ncbi:MAG TPA: cytochrome c oxidase accessory protein CcoG [Terrimicrobiaceae bacterium]|nr:cytochrome c oxidase accessory protein CcoG [Terrimicrobiaceae bacterium]
MKPKAPTIDSVTTINADGSRYFVHPADVRGFYTTLRRLSAPLLILIYVLLPMIPINGAPAVFIDVANRRFHLFGFTLIPQDLWLLFFLITGLGFSLFLVTAVFGRIWCGWACPQTVFLDHVFRRIERLIDGDAMARRRLDDAPLTAQKAAKRTVKHGLFFLVSLLIAHIFVSYFVSLSSLYSMVQRSPAENWGVFLFVFVLAAIMYFDFAWFREQFCIVLCPYGRLQSVMIDDDSIVIGYDEHRGEPRGKAGTTVGDCVDCRRCVQVCPTGIDIRQGLQLECISCANCIDACDEVMTKIGRRKGLIRYDSLNALAGRASRFIRPRIFLYAAFALAGAAVFLVSALGVRPVSLSVLRMQGAPYFRENGFIRNNYMLRLASKRAETSSYRIVVTAPGKNLAIAGGDAPLVLASGEEVQHPLILSLPDAEFTGNFDVTVAIYGNGDEPEAQRTIVFLGPFREGP